MGECVEFSPKISKEVLDAGKKVSFIPMPKVMEISGRIELDETISVIDGKRRNLTYFEDGDVIFAKITPCMENGKIARPMGLVNGAAYGSTEFHVLRPNHQIDGDYLRLFLVHDDFRTDAERAMTGAVGQRRVPRTYLDSYKLALPPLLEQKRIVEILDEHLSHLEAALASVRVVRVNAARFRRSLLHAAFTGALIGDDTSLGNVPKGWLSKNVGDFASIKTGKIDVNAAVEDGAYPFFTCAREIYRINEAPYEGRVVLIAGNGDLNVKYYEGKFNAYQRTYFLTVLDETKLLPKYLFQFMEMYVEHLRKISIGTTIKYIKLGDLRDAAICVPPLAHQEKIVEMLEEQLSRLDVSLAIADAIEKKSSALRRSLLHSAFTGELTKEWREGTHV